MENETHLLRLDEVVERCGLKKSSIYKMMSEGTFPKSVKLGTRSVAWGEKCITDWINSRFLTQTSNN